MGTEGLFLKSKYIYIIYKLPAVSGPFSWGGGEHSSGGRVLETDPAVCAHAMGVCVHAVERCVRVCVVHGGGAGSLLSPPGLSGAGGCWQGLVGGGVTGDGAGCRDAGLSPPTCPPPTLKPQAPHPAQPLSPPLPWAGGGEGCCAPPQAGASARCPLQHSPAAGGGQHGPGEGPQHRARLGVGGGSSGAGKGATHPVSPSRKGPLQPRHPRGHCPGCVRPPQRLDVLAAASWTSSNPPPHSPRTISSGDLGILP